MSVWLHAALDIGVAIGTYIILVVVVLCVFDRDDDTH